MDNVESCDGYIDISSLQTYKSFSLSLWNEQSSSRGRVNWLTEPPTTNNSAWKQKAKEKKTLRL
jgi:hypothetical protein